MTLQPITEEYRCQADCILAEEFGGPMMATNGVLMDLSTQPGYILVEEGAVTALATYYIHGGECELTCLVSLVENRGAGTALLEQVRDTARETGCGRMFLVTTNDNTRAIRFYQRRGMALVAVRLNALDISRQLKPQIPLVGEDGIPLQHEFEFELRL